MPTLPKPFRLNRPAALAIEHDAHRGSARARGYDARWDKASRAYRRRHPLCEYCLASAFGANREGLATRVDHLYPQRRFPGVFWRSEWWVASCDACDADKQSLERGPQAGLAALAKRMGRPQLQTPGGG